MTLKDLSKAATQGVWCQFGLSNGPYQKEAREAYDRGDLNKIDTSHHMSAVRDGEPYRIAEWKHANDAAFAEALVNAYRSGAVVEAPEWRETTKDNPPKGQKLYPLWHDEYFDFVAGYRGKDGLFYDIEMTELHVQPTHFFALPTPPQTEDRDHE